MKKISIIIFSIALVITACKKPDKKPAATSGGPSTPNPYPSLSLSTGGDLCALQTAYIYQDQNGTVTKDSVVFASFYETIVGSTVPTGIYAGAVLMNGIDLIYQSSSKYYYMADSPTVSIAGPITWSVAGSGTLSGFSQIYAPSYPKYTGGNLLPDTCVKANGITITIAGVSNNQSNVHVSLNSGFTGVTKYIQGSNGSVTFSADELAVFSGNQSFNIGISLSNMFTATHNGVKHGFQNLLNYNKKSYMK